MQYQNKISYKLYGRYALFSDPIMRMGGEKCSYQVPTYQALKGITESIYWKPTLEWYVDRVRIMRPVQTQSKGVKPMKYNDSSKNELSIYTYLYDVEYQVEAHFIWNEMRPDLEKDRNEHKHFCIAKRMLERGGKRDIFLGARECLGYVEPGEFGQGEGFYDNVNEVSFGTMFHGFDYPSETGENKLYVRLDNIVMKNGIIEFNQPRKDDEKFTRVFIKELDAENPMSQDYPEDLLSAEGAK